MAHLRFTYMSPSIERSLGYTVEEGLALGPQGLLTAESFQAATDLLAEELAIEARDPDHAYRQRVLEIQETAKDGSLRWCEMTAAFLRDENGQIAGILGVTRDITERRQAERALRESEATFRGLIDNMPDAVVVLDPNGAIQFFNRGPSGFEREELVGREVFEFVKPGYRQAYRHALRQAIETCQTQKVDCVDIYDLCWSCRFAPMISDGEARSVMVICTDVTERRRTERAVRKEQELLRQLLELHERDRKLLAFELHDGFAQQLTGAKLNLEAGTQLLATDPEQARESLRLGIQLLRESIEESRRLVSGLRPPVLDEFGIVPAIEHLVDENQGHGGPEIRFVSKGPFGRLARPLETAVFRIVQETLRNARRHSQSARIQVELSSEDGHVCVSVRDWGIGFDPGQVDEHRFGLRGIRERARLLGGEAEIHTAPGRGTWVRVRLPVVEKAPAKTAHAGDPDGHQAEIIPEPEG